MPDKLSDKLSEKLSDIAASVVVCVVVIVQGRLALLHLLAFPNTPVV